MSDQFLLILLFFLILVSGFFSGSETGMMALNRYRLRHLAKKSKAAGRVSKLLQKPDRILSVILVGNTFANILASAVATVLAVHWFGEIGVLIATVILTVIILIFAEITPKTLAAMHPEKVALPASLVLKWLQVMLYPVTWLLSGIAGQFLRLFGVTVGRKGIDRLSREELRLIVSEAMSKVSTQHKSMLIRLLDIEDVTVDDVMIPRNEIYGIDMDEDWRTIEQKILNSPYTWLPIYFESIDSVKSIVHLPKILPLMAENKLTKEALLDIPASVYYVPEGTSLHMQLINFRQEKCRVGMVVDEYGDIQGLVTLNDIFEEIVGEFDTEEISDFDKDVKPQKDGSYLIDGAMSVRDLNRNLNWKLPTNGPKTLSGVIVEELESMPHEGVGLRLAGYPIEIIEIKGKTVKWARVYPTLVERSSDQDEGANFEE